MVLNFTLSFFMKIKYPLFLILFILFTMPCRGQFRNPSDHYLFGNFGFGYAHIKDTGTSPLRYQGLYSNAEAAYKSIGEKVAFIFQGDLSYTAGFAARYYNLNYFIGGLHVSYLRTIPLDLPKNLRIRIGGILDASVSSAVNPDLQNATLNVDYLFDLMFGSQLEYDYSLKEKSGKFLFIKYKRPKRDFRAFFKLDFPVLLLNGRPEFAYLNPEDMDFFSREYYFGGYKMGTELGIKRYLQNGNIIEIKYDWDMYTSGKKDIYLLERASHNLTMAFYFKLN